MYGYIKDKIITRLDINIDHQSNYSVETLKTRRRQKIAVHVVGVEDGELFGFHGWWG